MLRKLALLLISAVVCTACLGGCWNRKEVEELAIVSAIGIDKVTIKGQDKFRITYQVVRPTAFAKQKEGGSKQPPSLILSSLGMTLNGAAYNLESRSPRWGTLAHCKVILLGERLVKEDGLNEVVDYLQRNRDIRMRNWVVVAQGEALTVMQAEPELEKMLSQEIGGMMSITGPRLAKASIVDLKEFLLNLTKPGKEAVASTLQVFTPEEKKFRPGGPPAAPPSPSVRLLGTAVFKKHKLVGYLREKETTGFTHILGKTRGGAISVRLPGHKDYDVAYVRTRTTANIEPEITGGKIRIKVRISDEGDLGEYEEVHIKATSEDLRNLEKLVGEAVKREARLALDKSQKEFKSDIFGFGDIIHRKYPTEWHKIADRWEEIYPEIEVSLEVSAKIRRTGMLGEKLIIK